MNLLEQMLSPLYSLTFEVLVRLYKGDNKELYG